MATPVSTVITYDSDVPAHVSALAALVSAGAVNYGAGIASGVSATAWHGKGIYWDDDGANYEPKGIWDGDVAFNATGIFDGATSYASGIFDGTDGTDGTRYDHGIWDVGTYSGDSGIFLEGSGIYPWQGAGIYDVSAGYNAKGIIDENGNYAGSGLFPGGSAGIQAYGGDGIYWGGCYADMGIFDGANQSSSGIFDGTLNGTYGSGIWDGLAYNPTGIFDGGSYQNLGIYATDGYHIYGVLADGSTFTDIADWTRVSTLRFPSAANVTTAEAVYGLDGELGPGELDMSLYALWQGAGIYTDTTTYFNTGIWNGTRLDTWSGSGIYREGEWLTDFDSTGVFDGTNLTPLADWALISGITFPAAANVTTAEAGWGVDGAGQGPGEIDMSLYTLTSEIPAGGGETSHTFA